jgi:hypothetical protein
MKLFKKAVYIVFLVLTIGCSDSKKSNLDSATISVKLVDEPGDYQNVFVEVIDVMVKYDNDSENDNEDEDSESGWQSLGIINPGVYDLLELTGGLSLELVDNETIEAGTIKQIRLILGANNSVVIEGEEESRPLRTPSAQQSGLKVRVNQVIEPGFNYDFILDFDVDESIVMAGNSGNINLKPVLRASLEVNSGILAGNILPTDIAVEVSAVNGAVMASTFTNYLGDFEILGLPAGMYTITITPEEASMLATITIENIEIRVGETNTLDPIVLE